MTTENTEADAYHENLLRFVKKLQQSHSTKRGKKAFNQLHPQLYVYLQADKLALQTELEQAYQTGDEKRANTFKRRLSFYYVVENFFLYLAKQGKSIGLVEVTTEMIKEFIELKPGSSSDEGIVPRKVVKYPNQYQVSKKTEIKAFFSRAEQNGIILSNPMTPLLKAPQKLAPKNMSPQTQADCEAFRVYLDHRVKGNLLSSETAEVRYRHFLILLHDAELRHIQNSSYPIELDDLFANPRWIWMWLNNLKNRGISSHSQTLARGSIELYLIAIRQIWLFLKSQGRAPENYYEDLKNMFREEGGVILLPGRASRSIESLSEIEEETVFRYIEQYSINEILRLRDLAIFITGIETTIRIRGLNSMRVENFKELEPGVWVCRVIIKRPSQKNQHSPNQLAEDKMVWGEWYMSPHAMAAIGQYLTATQRDWSSTGALWLTEDNTPLSYSSQQLVIRTWLKLAQCKSIRPHILRHVGIDRLVNKFRLPIPIVQTICQHTTPRTLLEVYAIRSKVDAFKEINKLFPQDEADPIKYQQLMLSTSTRLNEISALIGRRTYEGSSFNQEHIKELLRELDQQASRLVKILGYEATTEVVRLSSKEVLQIEQLLYTFGSSYRQILGFEPRERQPFWLNLTGRKPKIVLRS